MLTTDIIANRAERSTKAEGLPAVIANDNVLETSLFFCRYVNVCCLFNSVLE